MAAAIAKATGVEAELVAGTRGVFDVHADGVLLYSKDRTGRFPEDAEVLQALQARA